MLIINLVMLACYILTALAAAVVIDTIRHAGALRHIHVGLG